MDYLGIGTKFDFALLKFNFQAGGFVFHSGIILFSSICLLMYLGK
jgi:hypothetical protein